MNICAAVAVMRLLVFALKEHLEQAYSFDAVIGNRLRRDQLGPVRTCRVICYTGQRESLIPVRIFREMFCSYAGPNQRVRSEMTQYLTNASLTVSN